MSNKNSGCSRFFLYMVFASVMAGILILISKMESRIFPIIAIALLVLFFIFVPKLINIMVAAEERQYEEERQERMKRIKEEREKAKQMEEENSDK